MDADIFDEGTYRREQDENIRREAKEAWNWRSKIGPDGRWISEPTGFEREFAERHIDAYHGTALHPMSERPLWARPPTACTACHWIKTPVLVQPAIFTPA